MALMYFLRPEERVSSTGYSSTWVLLVNSPLPQAFEVTENTDASVKDKLEYIESAFDLRVVRVAELLGVSRQAVYDWKRGKSLSDENHRRLDALYKAAQCFKEAGLKLDYTTKHRLIGGELEFIEALGRDPLKAVEKLIELIKRGKKQREWLEKRLKTRPEPQGSIADDLPPHYPGE
jgi:transcriptional regulator with XRE-family HTH domain